MLKPEKMFGILSNHEDGWFCLYHEDSKQSLNRHKVNSKITTSKTLTLGAHNLLKVKCQMVTNTLVIEGIVW